MPTKISNDLVEIETNGYKMFVLQHDIGISKELLENGIREEEVTKMVSKKIKQGSTVIDIGANLGYYALLESLAAGKTGIVYAIEAVSDIHTVLKKNVALNNMTNIKTYCVAIGNKNATSQFGITNACNCGSMLSTDVGSWYFKTKMSKEGDLQKYINVKEQTLDTFRKNRQIKTPDFIRMDVEGYEVEIVRGMLETMKSMLIGSLILIEVHYVIFKDPEKYIEPMIDTLNVYGFQKILTISADAGPLACPHMLFQKQ